MFTDMSCTTPSATDTSRYAPSRFTKAAQIDITACIPPAALSAIVVPGIGGLPPPPRCGAPPEPPRAREVRAGPPPWLPRPPPPPPPGGEEKTGGVGGRAP